MQITLFNNNVPKLVIAIGIWLQQPQVVKHLQVALIWKVRLVKPVLPKQFNAQELMEQIVQINYHNVQV